MLCPSPSEPLQVLAQPERAKTTPADAHDARIGCSPQPKRAKAIASDADDARFGCLPQPLRAKTAAADARDDALQVPNRSAPAQPRMIFMMLASGACWPSPVLKTFAADSLDGRFGCLPQPCKPKQSCS